MAALRILVFGHSGSLALRPPRQSRQEGTYVDLLRRHVTESCGADAAVVNLALRSNMVNQDDLRFTCDIQRHDPDVVVLHYGVNECAPRVLPRPIWMWLHGFADQGWLRRRLGSWLMPMEVLLMRLVSCGGWLSAAKFERCLRFKIASVRKEAACRVLVVNIGPPNERYRRMLPGIERQVLRFNEVIARVAAESGALLMDVQGMVTAGGLEQLQPDGCHLSAEGHRQLFEMIKRACGD